MKYASKVRTFLLFAKGGHEAATNKESAHG